MDNTSQHPFYTLTLPQEQYIYCCCLLSSFPFSCLMLFISQREYDDIVINYLIVRGIPVTPPREVRGKRSVIINKCLLSKLYQRFYFIEKLKIRKNKVKMAVPICYIRI